MIKTLLAISLSAFVLTACGGSSSGGNDTGNGGSNTGGSAGGNTGGNAGGGGGAPMQVGGQTGSFGDTAAATGGLPGVFEVCPDSTAGSFSSFTQTTDGSWCVKRCPEGASLNGADDGDEWATYQVEGNNLTCNIVAGAPGTSINIFFTAPIDGCPDGGCPLNSFPSVFITPSAGSELAGSYTCTASVFDQAAQVWNPQTSPAPFALLLNGDFTADIAGTPTTWSFQNGVLGLEGSRSFGNVAVGTTSFTSYDSNTAITRCET